MVKKKTMKDERGRDLPFRSIRTEGTDVRGGPGIDYYEYLQHKRSTVLPISAEPPITVDAVLPGADFSLAGLRSAKRDLEAFELRYRTLSDICEIVARARAEVERLLSKESSSKPPLPGNVTPIRKG